jgi:bifunctional non-homologous end joining protein LigD
MTRSRKPNAPRRRREAPPEKQPRAKRRRASGPGTVSSKLRDFEIPHGVSEAEIDLDGGTVHLTNLEKFFWPELGLTKRDLLQYYMEVSHWLLPHLKDRAMVMKRYPNGVHGPFFFMKRAPLPRPDSIPICSIEHGSGNVIGFPVIQH